MSVIIVVFKRWLTAVESMLERTLTAHAPWTVVEATQDRYTRTKVFETIIDALEEELDHRRQHPRVPPQPMPEPKPSPTQEEKSHHYLWRFWRQLPKAGHITIFDRSWYGRVMVERVEGFCTEDEWKRAYREINEFERQLAEYGTVLVKFWLHIDPEEQLRRFRDRQQTSDKSWKITDEDWRNREKWSLYKVVVTDMLRRTNTTYAPWTILEANDKLHARIKALKTVAAALEAGLASPRRSRQ